MDKQDLRLIGKGRMSVNNAALESLQKTLKEFLARPSFQASYRNLPQFKDSKHARTKPNQTARNLVNDT